MKRNDSADNLDSFSRRRWLGAAGAGLATGLCASVMPVHTLARDTRSPTLIALNANENPYGPGPAARKAAETAINRGAYYDIRQRILLRDALAESERIDPYSVAISTGSNEALCAAASCWGRQGHILAPNLTYSGPLSYARRVGLTVKSVPLADDMSIDLNAMAAAVTDDTGLVYLCNPNNPTGMPLDAATLRAFCKKISQTTTVLVDEAYIELTEDPESQSMMDLVRAEANVVVTRTFSKLHGLAGMRVGYAMARQDLIQELASHIMSWNSHVGVSSALASMQDHEFLAMSRRQIAAGRDIITETFRRNGLAPLPSAANFVYADIGRDVTQFGQRMAERNILVGRLYEGYPTWLRVSVGRPSDLKVFSQAFDEVYATPA